MTLHDMLARSDQLDHSLMLRLDAESYTVFDDSNRIKASFGACRVALEHGRALRTLIAGDLHTSATALLRLQYEALTRSLWLLYSATDEEIALLLSPPTTDVEERAARMPSITKMINAMQGKAPTPASQMLGQFKDASWNALNSFVHGGIHPLQRNLGGYPEPLMIQILRNSNGLLSMIGMHFAVLTGKTEITVRMRTLQRDFMDCLQGPPAN